MNPVETSALLHGLEDIYYAWSLDGAPPERLIDDLYDFVIETYGPPF